jgi:hypothetical protein
MLEFLFKIGVNFYHHGQFRSVSEESSGAPTWQFTWNMLEFLFKSELLFTTTGSSRALTKAVQVRYSRQFRWAYEGSTGGGVR